MRPRAFFLDKAPDFIKQMENKHPGWFMFTHREFWRKRFETLKIQFPRVRDTDLLQKIGNEWDALDPQAKFEKYQKFMEGQSGHYIECSSQSVSQGMPIPEIFRDEQIKRRGLEMEAQMEDPKPKPSMKKKVQKGEPKVKLFVESARPRQLQQQEEDQILKQDIQLRIVKERVEKQYQDQEDQEELEMQKRILGQGKYKNEDAPQFVENAQEEDLDEESSAVLIQQAATMPKRTAGEEYQRFYKYYYQRLTVEHPNWTRSNLNTIISLLWKKRLATQSEQNKSRRKEREPKSAYQMFKRAKLLEGRTPTQAWTIWKALPFECRRKWQLQFGSHQPRRPPILTPSQLLKKGNEESRETPENPLRKLFSTKIQVQTQISVDQRQTMQDEGLARQAAILKNLFDQAALATSGSLSTQGQMKMPKENPLNWMNRK